MSHGLIIIRKATIQTIIVTKNVPITIRKTVF